MKYLFLGLAIVLEVVGSSFMKGWIQKSNATVMFCKFKNNLELRE